MTDKLIVWFEDVGKEDVGLVGGKGANLGEMTKSGFPVPQGFIVTSSAYFQFLEENKLQEKIEKILSKTAYDNTKSLDKTSKDIKSLITHGKMSEDLTSLIFKAYKKLSGVMTPALVAVRSSATAEDLPGASFAGQQETYLNVQGEANLLVRIKDAWASLFDARALFYRHEQKYDHMKVGIAIPVQKMVQSEKSGIMFTLDPVTNDKTKIVIEAVYGLGEMIVQGQVTPDHYEVSKKSMMILDKKVVVQTKKLIKKGTTNQEVSVSPQIGKQQKITDQQILELAELGRKLEKHYYFPQDSEWAIEGNNVYLVQTRPVTTTGNKAQVTSHDPGDNKIENAKLLLKGDPASPGMVSGPVKILQSAKEIDKIKQGEILVAPQTNPDFVPAMKKAIAIITDSGGRTCFAGNTKVFTDSGFITMEDLYKRTLDGEEFLIFAYDYLSKNPTWKKILSTQKNKLQAVTVEISQTGNMSGNTLDVTEDHRFYTYRDRALIKKSLRDILSQDEFICLVESLPERDQSLSTSEKLAYLLGALGTDGNIHLQRGTHTWRRGTITFTQKQTEEKNLFIETVNTYFSDIFQKNFKPRIKHSSSYIRGRLIQGLATDFRCYSLSIALEIQKLLQDLPLLASSFSEKTALHFLAGIIDGDGAYYNNRLNIYVGKTNILEGIIISCLRLGIIPQVTINRTISHVQIVERISDILSYSKRITYKPYEKILGTKLFAAKQLFGDIVDEVNYKGRLKSYVKGNLLLDYKKISTDIIPIATSNLKEELREILNSSIRMQRIRKKKDLGVIDVYNIEVEAKNELDHNYVVFSSRYTPILVSNSHAAIVSREIGIPAVVGTGKATTALKDGQIVTVNGSTGEIYEGGFISNQSTIRSTTEVFTPTATKVYVNLAQPEFAERVAKRHVDGVGLLRAEFMMADIGVHPKKMIRDGKGKEYAEHLASHLEQFCKVFSPRPVVYRASDFKTNEYRNLTGGRDFEPEESNPMLGYRGAFRYIHDAEVFNLELEAIKIVRNRMKLKNLWLMLPFVRTIDELIEVKKIISAAGLYRSPTFKLWMMVEIPSNVILIDDFIQAGIDGVSIGSNDLTMLILGTDRDNSEVASEFDEQSPAVLWALEKVIRSAHAHNITVSLCGQAASEYPDLLEKLIKWGITSVSVTPDVIDTTRGYIAEIEKKLIK